MSALRLEGVSKQYESDAGVVDALHGVDLAVEPGEFVSLVGRSGCGKTTLLNLSGAMDFPTEGKVIVDGIATAGLDDSALTRLRRKQVGFVFQFFQLLPTLTAAENVELPLQLAGERTTRNQAVAALEKVEMATYADRLPHEMSGGQQQRVAIARSLVHGPALLLADEPIGNLDSRSAEIVMNLLRSIAGESKSAIVMATHSLEAAELTDTIVQMRDGQIEDVRRL